MQTRAQRMDAAIKGIRQACINTSLDSQARSGLQGDLVFALVERGLFREAAAEFARLQAEGNPLRPSSALRW